MIYKIKNNVLEAHISDMGATLIKFIDLKTGKDLVLGFDEEEKYIGNSCYMGASVGRNANRIENGKILLNGKEYNLTINDNMNQLHGGGINGFSFKKWSLSEKTDTKLVFSYFSKDLEEGYPGNLTVNVTYELDENNLIWKYSGKADEDTILNMTNHSYFNFGDNDIMNHYLTIYTDKYSPIDEYSLTLDSIVDVKNTPYDFTLSTKVGDNLKQLESGIDNNYVYENMLDKKMATLEYDGLLMNVYSDLPDMHLYTGYYINDDIGKYNKAYTKYSGLCLECQYYPNAINYEKYIKPILKKNETMCHYIKYEIKHIGG